MESEKDLGLVPSEEKLVGGAWALRTAEEKFVGNCRASCNQSREREEKKNK